MLQKHFLGFLSGLLLLGSTCASTGFREDELECEQAVKHLSDCCSGFASSNVVCSYSPGCGTTDYPALSVETSRCIEAKSCADLISEGVCSKAQSAPPLVIQDDGGTKSARSEVCQ